MSKEEVKKLNAVGSIDNDDILLREGAYIIIISRTLQKRRLFIIGVEYVVVIVVLQTRRRD
jgi:hypothetical protein